MEQNKSPLLAGNLAPGKGSHNFNIHNIKNQICGGVSSNMVSDNMNSILQQNMNECGAENSFGHGS